MTDEKTPSIPGTSGRTCSTCTMCCKIMGIAELKKPRGKWCQNCNIGKGCKIYDTKPDECSTFQCGWMMNQNLEDFWKPNKSKIILMPEDSGNRVAAHVDTSRPDAWRKEPYYSTLKRWAVNAERSNGQVMIYVGEHIYMIMPDEDYDLGIVADDETLIMQRFETPTGIRRKPLKVKKDDPRIKNMQETASSTST